MGCSGVWVGTRTLVVHREDGRERSSFDGEKQKPRLVDSKVQKGCIHIILYTSNNIIIMIIIIMIII